MAVLPQGTNTIDASTTFMHNNDQAGLHPPVYDNGYYYPTQPAWDGNAKSPAPDRTSAVSPFASPNMAHSSWGGSSTAPMELSGETVVPNRAELYTPMPDDHLAVSENQKLTSETSEKK